MGITQIQEDDLKKEEVFSDKEFANSNKIFHFTLIQICIILLIGVWQIFSLRKYIIDRNVWPF